MSYADYSFGKTAIIVNTIFEVSRIGSDAPAVKSKSKTVFHV